MNRIRGDWKLLFPGSTRDNINQSPDMVSLLDRLHVKVDDPFFFLQIKLWLMLKWSQSSLWNYFQTSKSNYHSPYNLKGYLQCCLPIQSGNQLIFKQVFVDRKNVKTNHYLECYTNLNVIDYISRERRTWDTLIPHFLASSSFASSLG